MTSKTRVILGILLSPLTDNTSYKKLYGILINHYDIGNSWILV